VDGVGRSLARNPSLEGASLTVSLVVFPSFSITLVVVASSVGGTACGRSAYSSFMSLTAFSSAAATGWRLPIVRTSTSPLSQASVPSVRSHGDSIPE
jgi:hypothetical protein